MFERCVAQQLAGSGGALWFACDCNGCNSVWLCMYVCTRAYVCVCVVSVCVVYLCVRSRYVWMIKGHCFFASSLFFFFFFAAQSNEMFVSRRVALEGELGHILLHNLQHLSDSDSFIFISKREATHLGE